MRNVKIEVEKSKFDGGIGIRIQGALFTVDSYSDTRLAVWLDKDTADKLSFQISSLLQEIERSDDIAKYDERRDMAKFPNPESEPE